MVRKTQEPVEPEPEGDEEGEFDEEDDALIEEFAREWESVKKKTEAIPDNIGDMLSQILKSLGVGGGGSGRGRGTNEPGRAAGSSASRPSGASTTPTRQAAGFTEQDQGGTEREPEKRPESTNWYFKPRRGKRN